MNVVAALSDQLERSPCKRPDDLLFAGNVRQYRHGTKRELGRGGITRGWVLAKFREALAKIGIDRLEQSSRRLRFHSWRHTAISELRGEIEDSVLKPMVGHSESSRTTDLYTRALRKHLMKLQKTMERMYTEE